MRDRRSERHAATKAEILDVAWELVREQGLAGLSLRDLAARVGMRAPSLYSYFPSKHAIYDAMFAQGYEALLAGRHRLDAAAEGRPLLVRLAQEFLGFCVEDPPRYQLLFQRTIPGFEPSEASYALAMQALHLGDETLARAGVRDPSHRDLWTALLTGLADQQISNDPGGDRWSRLAPGAVDMFLAHVTAQPRRDTKRRRRR